MLWLGKVRGKYYSAKVSVYSFLTKFLEKGSQIFKIQIWEKKVYRCML